MAKVKTYNLTIYFDKFEKTFRNISRVAADRYIKFYQDHPDFCGSRVEVR